VLARAATADDAAAMAAIYNQAIADRASTFETRPRTPDDVAAWIGGPHPVLVVEDRGEVVAYAATFPYSARDCYRGVAEFSVYVSRSVRGRGIGRVALSALIDAAREAGFWKLVSKVFPENLAIRRLNRSLGVREVGVHEKHARLDGIWRDVIVVELLIPENIV